MKSKEFHHEVKVYYEATDLNGHVNYATYMNYFSRAREELIGFENFSNLVNVKKLGMAVYNANIKYRGSAKFGEILDIRTTAELDGEFKLLMHQEIWVKNHKSAIVTADFEIVCIHVDTGMLNKIPSIDGLKY